ncbi:PRC-barrel domain-containing protein [Jannaschia donghaensis]|uniref:PRC-barrel domain protein n=1 Tax=Jannaschia donghaensis TaxID=420998 RepID=A0A0M6YEQ0_9RHOB|nr:PRC-barrel domain-containing protein [Jannaschia donghaensis]CTQ48832.1 PRC-barrel domain protein [Jannaschia donghaensis]
MKTLMASTAIALSLATPGFSDGHVSSSFVQSLNIQALRASDLMGARLYVTEQAGNLTTDDAPEWDDVGEISDILIGAEGGIDAVMIDIGGFIGMGERTVAVNVDDLTFVSDGADADEFFVVLTGTTADLEGAPAFDGEVERGRDAAIMSTTDDMAQDESPAIDEAPEPEQIEETEVQGTGLDTQATAGTETLATIGTELSDAREPIAGDLDVQEEIVEADPDTMDGTDMMEREGYTMVSTGDVTAEDIIGITVYDPNDEAVGEIGELLGADGGMADRAVIDVGGFLGLGEKPVAVDMSDITLMQGENDLRAYIASTEDELEAMPTHED